jgi:DNA-binding ferritin-like protein
VYIDSIAERIQMLGGDDTASLKDGASVARHKGDSQFASPDVRRLGLPAHPVGTPQNHES